MLKQSQRGGEGRKKRNGRSEEEEDLGEEKAIGSTCGPGLIDAGKTGYLGSVGREKRGLMLLLWIRHGPTLGREAEEKKMKNKKVHVPGPRLR